MIDTIRLKVTNYDFYKALEEYKNINIDESKKAIINLQGLKEKLLNGEVIEISINDVKDIKNLDADLLISLYEKGIDINFLDYFKLMGLGSWNRDINVFLDCINNSVYLEFSLNKMIFAHNLYNYEDSVYHLYDFLSSLYCRFGVEFNYDEFSKIELYRLDLAYNYKFDFDVVNYIKSVFNREGRYKRKKIHFYDSSLMLVGSTYSLKLYNKHEEFKKHDYKELSERLKNVSKERILKSLGYFIYKGKEINVDETDNQVLLSKILKSLLDYSVNIYRFELSIRRKKLEYDNILTLGDLDKLDLLGYYEGFLLDFGLMEVRRYKMEDLYNMIDDVNLLTFCLFVKEFGLESAKARYKRSTFYYYKKKLKEKYDIDINLLRFEENKVISFKPSSSNVPIAVAV